MGQIRKIVLLKSIKCTQIDRKSEMIESQKRSNGIRSNVELLTEVLPFFAKYEALFQPPEIV